MLDKVSFFFFARDHNKLSGLGIETKAFMIVSLASKPLSHTLLLSRQKKTKRKDETVYKFTDSLKNLFTNKETDGLTFMTQL